MCNNFNNFSKIDCSVKEFEVEYSSDGHTFTNFDDKTHFLSQYEGNKDEHASFIDNEEYLIKNNHEISIEELANLLKGMNVYVNLIPYNETNNIDFKKSNRVNEFKNTLLNNKINVTVRREFGGNISAACGQLRSKEV